MSKNQIFISYRREGGSELARNVKEGLEKRGFKVFMDIEDLRKGPFPPRIYKSIEDSSDLVVILTPNALDRCWEEEDWVKNEIAFAIKKGKNLVPVIHRDFKWPSSLPPEIDALRSYQGLSSDYEYFDASMDGLAKLIKGRKYLRPKYLGVGLSLITAIIIAFYFLFKPSTVVCDKYLCIDTPEKFVGTMLSEKPYDLNLMIKNRTSTEIYISDVIVKKYNKEAAKLMGLPNDLIHVGEFHGPILIEPHKQREINIIGNEILPTKAEISILQSLSGKPSFFKLSLPYELQKMPEPRILPRDAVYTGIDGIPAIQRAIADALTWSDDAHVIAAFPAESNEFLEPQSRLKVLSIKSWVVTLFSRSQDKYYTAIVQGNVIIDKKTYFGRDNSNLEDRNPTPIPVLGNQRALEFVNTNRLICGNWKGLRLSNVRLGTYWSLAWFLPYRGPDSFPLVVDAVTGSLLAMGSKEESFKKKSIQDQR